MLWLAVQLGVALDVVVSVGVPVGVSALEGDCVAVGVPEPDRVPEREPL